MEQSIQKRKDAELLGPGLHLVHLDLGSVEEIVVRAMDGRRIAAVLAEGVDSRLVAECRRAGKAMIACDTNRGVTIVGALQTAPSIERSLDGTLVLEGKRVHIKAEESVVMKAGAKASMEITTDGKTQLIGERMTIDMSATVQVLSASVELP